MIFDKRLLWTGGAVIVTGMVAVVAALWPRGEPESLPLQENVSGVEIEVSELPAEPEYQYRLQEYDGRIGVFIADEEEPEMVLPVMTKYLPDVDREAMQQGIPVYSYAELVALLEDYGS